MASTKACNYKKYYDYYKTSQYERDHLKELGRAIRQVDHDIFVIENKVIPLLCPSKIFQQKEIEKVNTSCFYVNDCLAKFEIIYREGEENLNCKQKR